MSRAALHFGRALREIRTKRGWSQADFAERTGLSVNAISAFERGERFPRATTIDQLLVALGDQVSLVPLPLEIRERAAPAYAAGDAPEDEDHSLGALVDLLRDEPEYVVAAVVRIARLLLAEVESVRRAAGGP